jgi:phage shock protein E
VSGYTAASSNVTFVERRGIIGRYKKTTFPILPFPPGVVLMRFHRFRSAIVVLAVAIGALSAVSVRAADHTTDTPAEVKQAIAEKKAVLVDVREEVEWKNGHLAAAILFPLSDLRREPDEKQLAKLPKDKIIYTHCRSGVRSVAAGEILRKLGYEVRYLKPGYQDLLKAGFEPAQDDADQ